MINRRIIFTTDARLAVTPSADGKPAVLVGYPIVWNVLSTDRGGYRVRLLPNSAQFATPTHALRHHDWRDVLGCTENGTLRLTPDTFGVRCEIDLPDTSVGRDVAVLIARKDIRGMSFAMVDTPDSTEITENDQTILNVKSFLCDEVTVTASPAFAETTVAIQDRASNASKPQPTYKARREQALQLQRLKLDSLRLPGAEIPRRS
jgi:HK97 family phage prohead protease